jgi:hypothetical protein
MSAARTNAGPPFLITGVEHDDGERRNKTDTWRRPQTSRVRTNNTRSCYGRSVLGLPKEFQASLAAMTCLHLAGGSCGISHCGGHATSLNNSYVVDTTTISYDSDYILAEGVALICCGNGRSNVRLVNLMEAACGRCLCNCCLLGVSIYHANDSVCISKPKSFAALMALVAKGLLPPQYNIPQRFKISRSIFLT